MHIVITGASSGIGAALAREFSKIEGARLTLVARRESALRNLAEELDVPTLVVRCDLSDITRATEWVENAERVNGPVDVLINNAGVQVVAPTDSVDVAAGEASVAVNLLAPLRLTNRVLPGMLRRRRGSIVDIASMAALAPTPFMTYYNASKAGLAAATEALRGELRGTGVHVMPVYPGIIGETALAQAALQKYESSAMLRAQPQGTTAELARQVRQGVLRKRARVVFPRVYGLTRWFPTITRWFMDRFSPPLSQPTRDAPLPARTMA